MIKAHLLTKVLGLVTLLTLLGVGKQYHITKDYASMRIEYKDDWVIEL